MKQSRSWISLITFCLMTVFGSALAFALIVAGGSVALANHQSSQDSQSAPSTDSEPSDLATFSGMITDSYCGARHQRYRNLRPQECAAACIRGGAKYVLVDGDHRYNLTGANQSLGKLLGTRANVTGTRDGDTIVVSSAGPMS